jgi:hypothetical protein
MHYVPGGKLRLRVPVQMENIGIDRCEMGESAYGYVGLEAELIVVPEAPQNIELDSIRSDDSP